jgi:SOS response regulatory protein OraA/RecX
MDQSSDGRSACREAARRAYRDGLALVSCREMTEAQLGKRLLSRGHQASAVAEAIERLRSEGAIDDRRAAASAARVEANVKGRGRRRILQRLRAVGVPESLATETVDNLFEEIDEKGLLARALERKLKGSSARTPDPSYVRRLYQALVRQGFAPGDVMAALRARWRSDVPSLDE